MDYVDRDHPDLSISKQCDLFGIKRNRLYYKPQESKSNLELMKLIDQLYVEDPTRGQRRLKAALKNQYGRYVGRAKIRVLMRRMGIAAIYPKKDTSQAHPTHKKYPYLLRGVTINRVNQVWSTDITYVRLESGFVYLCAIIDWHSRAVLSWRLSTTMHADFCVEALREARDKYGEPEIFNTDQGVQFTCEEFQSELAKMNTKVSMDGRGRALDNVFVERLWRTVKYENIFIKEYNSVKECYEGLKEYFEFYNHRREHSKLDYDFPMNFYFNNRCQAEVA